MSVSSFFSQHPHSADGHRNDYRMYLSAAHIIASSRSHLLNVDVDKRGYIKLFVFLRLKRI
ncbi:hypothetical protein DVJ97_09110 [Staphylococcus aureus]|nr:hypothetical protein [Staphylococcus aureus]ORN41887.1 hypothetical protein B8A21_14010 [Staphylococcus aureus]RQX58355.1 hypothetical protein DB787_04875 [Staphylococcus aureus]